ncbi:hypothetical protein ET495_00980 [Xylanimonas allomyrinae]|uniref:NodB homology domain-containing protein n=1 Tax=Xylanimonas allomyrinae TaxID=2509459 RepID=A0A4V0YDW1_9MICO|nr:polysaccharide deacetylase family protein [Xylanimonas allomyrinae]QAY62091.1 hypothetical protein ET495_00980 [Xylanimonas allomyrinae]
MRVRRVHVIGAAVAATLVVGAPLVVDTVMDDRPVVGLRLEGASRWQVWTDASGTAARRAQDRAADTLTLRAGTLTRTPTLDDLGLVDGTRDLRTALLAAGRDGSAWQDALAQTRAAWGGERVTPPPDRLDPARLSVAVDAIADDVAVPPVDATLTLSGDVVRVRDDVPGIRLDTPGARRAIADAVRAGRRSAHLPTRAVPAAVTEHDLAAVEASVHAAVARPLVLGAGDARVTVPRARVFAALPVTVSGGTAVVVPDAAALAPEIAEVSAQAERLPALRIVMAGTVVAPGADGVHVDAQAAAEAVLAELRARTAGGGADVVPLPVTTLPAPVQEATAGAFAGDHAVHLTFDDGPGAHTEAILDVLAAKGAHATFYVLGERAREHPETVRRILAEGHRLGNHTTTHPDLTTLAPEQAASEIASTQALLTEITGVRPTAFRPPYGAVNDAVRAAAAAEHLSVDLWTLDTQDWRGPGAAAVCERVLSGAQPGSVVLLHVLRQGTVDALPGIIDGLRARGLAVD